MHDITRDFLVSLTAFATLFGIVYVVVITRHRERMSMLDKGVTASLFDSKGTSNTLKFGMLAVAVALGILTGHVLGKNDILDRAPAYFSMTFLFGGISLILNYIIDRSLRK
jgi:hypothetical protein